MSRFVIRTPPIAFDLRFFFVGVLVGVFLWGFGSFVFGVCSIVSVPGTIGIADPEGCASDDDRSSEWSQEFVAPAMLLVSLNGTCGTPVFAAGNSAPHSPPASSSSPSLAVMLMKVDTRLVSLCAVGSAPAVGTSSPHPSSTTLLPIRFSHLSYPRVLQ